MKKSLDNLIQAMNDISALIELSNSVAGKKQEVVLFRSAIVLIVASWEQFIEQLAENSVLKLTGRFRNSDVIPEDVKQSVALYKVPEKRTNQFDLSKSVWAFSDSGWKKTYLEYCNFSTSRLNTASSENVNELYKRILGIKEVTASWSFNNLPSKECSEKLDILINIRHDIAHGANRLSKNLDEIKIKYYVRLVTEIARCTYLETEKKTEELFVGQALTYSLSQSCYIEIIKLGMLKVDRILTLDEIKSLGSSAQGNHNKLCYKPWALLERIGRTKRRVTDGMINFSKGDLTLPYEILVFANGEAVPAPNTRYLSISELINEISKNSK